MVTRNYRHSIAGELAVYFFLFLLPIDIFCVQNAVTIQLLRVPFFYLLCYLRPFYHMQDSISYLFVFQSRFLFFWHGQILTEFQLEI